MTLDEAIERYKNNAEYERTHGNLQGCHEFRQLAEWLKDYKRLLDQDPCGDAISRQAVLEIAKSSKSNWIDNSVLFKRVNELPSVTPQPKTGHWEQYGDPWEDKFKCSECGKEQPKILCGQKIIGHWSDYCPNCGARMIEPQESEG